MMPLPPDAPAEVAMRFLEDWLDQASIADLISGLAMTVSAPINETPGLQRPLQRKLVLQLTKRVMAPGFLEGK